jgi:pantoate--beta-alanine ligase
MLTFTKRDALRKHLDTLQKTRKTLGFVPTMGALHPGHLSLVKASKKQCDLTICSVFVNPTQFNDRSDLERYPRMPESDSKMLAGAECDILFMPDNSEMYDGQITRTFDLGYLDKILEGEHRPGHFQGVAQVVNMFFELIKPDKAFFGSKDYQQVMVIKELVRQTGQKVEIISCPILREPDGLAMSSRNSLLSRDERILASNIPSLMRSAVAIISADSVSAAKKYIRDQLGRFPGMTLDYFEVCDAATLRSLDNEPAAGGSVALIAVFIGKIRLIDNLLLS